MQFAHHGYVELPRELFTHINSQSEEVSVRGGGGGGLYGCVCVCVYQSLRFLFGGKVLSFLAALRSWRAFL